MNQTAFHVLMHVLTIVFVVLKLTGAIDWSWWWVTLPSYGPFSLGLVFLALAALIRWNEMRGMTPSERADYLNEERRQLLLDEINRRVRA